MYALGITIYIHILYSFSEVYESIFGYYLSKSEKYRK